MASAHRRDLDVPEIETATTLRRHANVLIVTFLTSTSFGAALPFLAARLEAMGVSGGLLGLNAAMSALGLLSGSLGLPVLQKHLSANRILLGSLAGAVAVWTAFFFWTDYWSWTVLRLLFGGAIGVFFRTVEFGLNAATDDGRRTTVFGYYNLAFGGGIALGAALVPVSGSSQPILWSLGSAGYAIAAAVSARGQSSAVVETRRGSTRDYLHVARLALLPLAGAFVYGTLESIPGYFLPIHALRNGLGSDVSAYSLTVAALGAVVVPLLFGLRGERVAPRRVLLLATSVVCLMSVALSFSVQSAPVFLVSVSVWAGFFATLYTASLAVLGSEHGPGHLPNANSAFGVAYASGGLIGPLLNGSAIDMFSSRGWMFVAVVASSLLAAVCLTSRGRRTPESD